MNLGKQSGFTLIETMIGAGLVGVLLSAGLMWQGRLTQERIRENVAAMLSEKKAHYLNLIDNDAAWAQTESLNGPASHLGCIGSTGCLGLTAPSTFSIYDATGATVFDSSAGGLNLDGSTCSSSCAIEFQLSWTPSCAAADTGCRFPLVQIKGTFSSKILPGTINLAKYGFQISRSSFTTTACKGALPSCGGDIVVCESSGWACAPARSTTCSGPVSWNDEKTAFGPCTATISSPVLHNVGSPSIPATSAGLTGNATFLCIPGEPNNGFIVQTGATCSSAPINGLCGGASGGTFVDATAATAAGLCSAGTLSAPLTGGGPWTWACNGLTGGTNASCSATATSTLPLVACYAYDIWENIGTGCTEVSPVTQLVGGGGYIGASNTSGFPASMVSSCKGSCKICYTISKWWPIFAPDGGACASVSGPVTQPTCQYSPAPSAPFATKALCDADLAAQYTTMYGSPTPHICSTVYEHNGSIGFGPALCGGSCTLSGATWTSSPLKCQ